MRPRERHIFYRNGRRKDSLQHFLSLPGTASVAFIDEANGYGPQPGTVCPSLCADGGQVVGARQVIDTRAQSLP